MAQQQKVLLYVLPLIFAFSGVNFPIGVLLYWTTTNLWSMGQQFYTIRRMPAPGSEAEKAFKERQARKAARRGGAAVEDAAAPTAVIEDRPKSGQRQQPKRKDRAKGGAPAARPSAPQQTDAAAGSTSPTEETSPKPTDKPSGDAAPTSKASSTTPSAKGKRRTTKDDRREL
jgi:YidC/Oxa1 family membrane protein insertase